MKAPLDNLYSFTGGVFLNFWAAGAKLQLMSVNRGKATNQIARQLGILTI